MKFGRKKEPEEEVVSGTVVPEQTDPAGWALPADAGVAAGAGEQDEPSGAEAVAPATAAGGAARAPDDHGERTTDDSTTILEQAVGEDDPAAGGAGDRPGPEAPGAATEPADSDDRGEGEAGTGEPASTVSGSSVTSPGLGADASPRAAAAANQQTASGGGSGGSEHRGDSPAGTPSPAAAGAGSAPGPLAPILQHPTVQQKPELAVLGAFAGAFVVARILKAITSPE